MWHMEHHIEVMEKIILSSVNIYIYIRTFTYIYINIYEKQRWKMKERLQRTLDKYHRNFWKTKENGVSIADSRMSKDKDR